MSEQTEIEIVQMTGEILFSFFSCKIHTIKIQFYSCTKIIHKHINNLLDNNSLITHCTNSQQIMSFN